MNPLAIFAAMRIVHFLFALYILVLSVSPCTGEHEYTHAPVKTSSDSARESSDHPHEHEGLCSPFCICHCTGGFVLTFPQQPEFSVSAVSYQPEASFWYAQSQPRGYSYSIWQPPVSA